MKEREGESDGEKERKSEREFIHKGRLYSKIPLRLLDESYL